MSCVSSFLAFFLLFFFPLSCLAACPDTFPSLTRWSQSSFASASAGSDVTIGAGQRILLDMSVPALRYLTISGGLLVFSPLMDHTLSFRGVEVINNGQLWIGADDCPFTRNVQISLTGEKADSTTAYGNKYIAVDTGGVLEIHGAPVTEWTFLTQTVNPGTNSIVVDGSVNWAVGQSIVIAHTDYYDTAGNEVFTISATAPIASQPPTTQLTLSGNLAYRHFAGIIDAGGTPVTVKAEVASLSRNIVIQGAMTTQSNADSFGGHVICVGSVTCQFSNALFRFMGQMNIKARYPIHFHQGGEGQNTSFAKNVVVRDSFQRCVVVHGTHRLRIENVVSLTNIGHCIFLEDAIEKLNTFLRVLSIDARAPPESLRYQVDDTNTGLRPHDFTPSSFWITHPLNVFSYCHAVGSRDIGFWFAPPDKPIGLASSSTEVPIEQPMLNFTGNVAHSNGGFGIHLDGNGGVAGSGNQWMNPRDNMPVGKSDPYTKTPGGDRSNWVLRNSMSYKNRGNGGWARGDSIFFDGLVLIDNSVGFGFAGNDMRINNVIFMIDSPISAQLTFPWGPPGEQAGYRFYHAKGPTAVSNAKFINYRNVSTTAFGPNYFWRVAHAVTTDAAGVSVYVGRSRWYNIQFINTDARVEHETYPDDAVNFRPAVNEFTMIDTHGDFTGTCGAILLPLSPPSQAMVSPEKCRPVFRNLQACDATHNAVHAVIINTSPESTWNNGNAPNGDPTTATRLRMTRLGDKQTFIKQAMRNPVYGSDRIVYYDVLVAAQTTYLIQFGLDLTPNNFRLSHHFIPSQEWVRFVIPYPPGTTFAADGICLSEFVLGGCLTPVTTLSQLTVSTYYYDTTSNLLWLHLSSHTNRYDYFSTANPYSPFVHNEVLLIIKATCTGTTPPANPFGWTCHAPNVNVQAITGGDTIIQAPFISRCGDTLVPKTQKPSWSPTGSVPDHVVFNAGQYSNSWNCDSCTLDTGVTPAILDGFIEFYYNDVIRFRVNPVPTDITLPHTHLVMTLRIATTGVRSPPSLYFNLFSSPGYCGKPAVFMDAELNSPFYMTDPPISTSWETIYIPLADFGITSSSPICGFSIRGLTRERRIAIEIQSVRFQSLTYSLVSRPSPPCIFLDQAQCDSLAAEGFGPQYNYPLQATRYPAFFGLNSTLHVPLAAIAPPVSSSTGGAGPGPMSSTAPIRSSSLSSSSRFSTAASSSTRGSSSVQSSSVAQSTGQAQSSQPSPTSAAPTSAPAPSPTSSSAAPAPPPGPSPNATATPVSSDSNLFGQSPIVSTTIDLIIFIAVAALVVILFLFLVVRPLIHRCRRERAQKSFTNQITLEFSGVDAVSSALARDRSTTMDNYESNPVAGLGHKRAYSRVPL